MNFFKNHFEKLLFAVVLTALLASVILTRPWAKPEQKPPDNSTSTKPNEKPVKPESVQPEEILAKLDTPFVWDTSGKYPNLFTPNHRVVEITNPTTGQKILIVTPLNRARTDATTPEARPTGPITTVEQALNLQDVVNQPFHLQFKGFSRPTDKKKFQVNYVDVLGKLDTQYVDQGGTVQGFMVKEYREKKQNNEDISELDVQRGTDPVITLLFNKLKIAGTAPVAAIKDVASRTVRHYKTGDTLFVELEEEKHPSQKRTLELKLIDIQLTRVLLEETVAPNKQYTLTK